MTIDRWNGDRPVSAKTNGATRPDHAVASERAAAARNGTGSETAQRADQVEISTEGRALSASQELDSARLEQIQQRLADGTYHTAEVAERIAVRLLSEMA
ncbi:MAG: flagellar biosynthesis anti-sigma factor FlgM [Longimicrobiales bacterium]